MINISSKLRNCAAMATSGLVLTIAMSLLCKSAEARSLEATDGVIPSPNQDFSSESELLATAADIQRMHGETIASIGNENQLDQAAASSEQFASVPVYASPFARAEQAATIGSGSVAPIAQTAAFDRQESSHAPPNYAPRPSASSASAASSDLKASASYGHHHHGGHGYGPSGWLDMGAWTGGKGSFGWYADYPVGGKGGHHYGYHGRK